MVPSKYLYLFGTSKSVPNQFQMSKAVIFILFLDKSQHVQIGCFLLNLDLLLLLFYFYSFSHISASWQVLTLWMKVILLSTLSVVATSLVALIIKTTLSSPSSSRFYQMVLKYSIWLHLHIKKSLVRKFFTPRKTFVMGLEIE